MSNLLEIYEARLKGVDLSTASSLESLLRNDEKTFYFALMYFYLSDKPLGTMLRTSPVLSNSTTLFCQSTGDTNIQQYYSQYLDLREIPEQVEKIYKELKLKG